MKRKTIKELEVQIERLENDKSYWYNKFAELQKEKEKDSRNTIFNLEQENSDLKDQTRNLLEIIRWQINPETTRVPFRALMKEGDRDLDNRRNN